MSEIGEWMQMLPGVKRRIVADGDKMMVVEIHLAKGSVVPRHSHIHEQASTIYKGKLRFEFDSGAVEYVAGQVAFMVSMQPHRVIALEDTIAYDAFSPPREDFRVSGALDPKIYGQQ
jgi:quercetin dioxygenase-like cupin family protein